MVEISLVALNINDIRSQFCTKVRHKTERLNREHALNCKVSKIGCAKETDLKLLCCSGRSTFIHTYIYTYICIYT